MENYPDKSSDALATSIRSLEQRMTSLEERFRSVSVSPRPAERPTTTDAKKPEGFVHLSPYGGYTVEFERRYDQNIDQVWRTMTDPSRLIDWYADADVEPREGGKIELRFANSGAVAQGIVTEYDPPSVFEHVWVTGQAQEPAQPMPDRMSRGGGTCGDTSLAASVIRYELTRLSAGSTAVKVSHYAPMNPSLIAKPLSRSANRSSNRPSEVPAPDMVLATWETLLELLDNAIANPGNRAMSLRAERSGGWPWDKFDERRQKYAQVIRSGTK